MESIFDHMIFMQEGMSLLMKLRPYLGAFAGTILIGVMIWMIYKKTKLFKDNVSIMVLSYLLIGGILYWLTFYLLRLNNTYFSYIYYSLMGLSLIGGIVYTILIHKLDIKWVKKDGFWKEFLLNFSIAFGIAFIGLLIFLGVNFKANYYFFDHLYVLLGLFPFIMPLVFYKAYVTWMKIPSQQFKAWKYPVGRSVPRIELVDTTILHIDLLRQPEDLVPISTRIRAPRHERISDLFYYFLSKYNSGNTEDNKIDLFSNYDEQKYFDWLFYKKEGMGGGKMLIDPDRKVIDLELVEEQHIIVERVNY